VVSVELISMFTEEEVDLTIPRKATIYESVSIHDR
jgi:hypothetical protein